MIKPAATNLTIDWAQHSHFLPKDTHEVNLHVWLAKAAAEGDIAMKLNITEPSVQAYLPTWLAVTKQNELNRYAAAPTAM
jgi:hypothetical protein